MAFVSGYLLYAHMHGTVFGMAVPVFTGMTYAVAILVAAVSICVFLPRLRFMIESIAVARLLIAVTAFLLPGLGEALRGSPELSAALLVGAAAVLSKLVYGHWSPRALHREAERHQTIVIEQREQEQNRHAPDLAAFLLADQGANPHARYAESAPAQPLALSLRNWMDDSLGRVSDRLQRPATSARPAFPAAVAVPRSG
ncbi:hypothetical protein [Ruegeria marisrubri]|nr:hypothetical protein [Ruegeria marisrubri]